MKKQIYLVGIGTGSPETMTLEAKQAIESCGCLIGASRMLSSLGVLAEGKELQALISSDEILEFIRQDCSGTATSTAVILSGDTGFYSGAKKLYLRLPSDEFEVHVVCGISSLVYFCGRLQIPWDDVEVVSVHGRAAKVLNPVMINRRVFLLTGGEGGRVDQVCSLLCEKGLGMVHVFVGERLSYPEERIVAGTAEELSKMEFDSLSVMLVENERPLSSEVRAHGLADEAFLRGSVPMTKQEIRSVALSKLAPRESDICWDVGAGTGSVSVELALLARQGTVYAVERNAEALGLIEANRKKFGVFNLEVISGSAPEALADLPAPDRVFIGGSGKQLEAVLRLVLEKNPKASAVITAIALETAAEALRVMEELGFLHVEAVSITAARAKKAGGYHMMMGQNPVYVISGIGQAEEEA